ncbi:MAG: ImuA family protein [Phycisphaerales bacterium JB041]
MGARCWVPPVAVLVDLARGTLTTGAGSGGTVLWIGQRCWAYPHALAPRERREATAQAVGGQPPLLERSVFVDARTTAERVWAAELAARSGAVSAVIADGTGLRMADSRRLQLAAESCKTVVLLARPDTERGELSAARSRWLVEPSAEPGLGLDQQWIVTLLRCKGVQPTVGSARRWAVRREHATGIVRDWQACGGDLAVRVVDRRTATA